jgi:hypothetical protein
MRRASVSACLIVKDEEERLPACLESLAFCDEIVVVDSGSTDRTREVARAAGARVIENPWPGYAAQRNVALDAANGDWILEIDADERVTPRLRAEIEAFLDAPPEGVTLAALPRRDRFLGKPLGPAAKYPQYRHRLFLRGAYRHDESRTVHEGLWAYERPHAFSGDLDHVMAATVGEAVHAAWNYARLEARQHTPPASLRSYAIGMALRPAIKFWFRASVLGGWRDGWRGLARIALECASDVVVWARQLVTRTRQGAVADAPAGHFAEPPPRAGSVRMVGIAAGASDTNDAVEWLSRAAAAGVDATLVTDEPVRSSSGPRVVHVPRMSPLILLRTLDGEEQLRTIDAIVPVGRRAARVTRLLGRILPAAAGAVSITEDPQMAERRVRAATRPVGGSAPPGPAAVAGEAGR